MNFELYSINLWSDGDSTVIGLVQEGGYIADVANDLEGGGGGEEWRQEEEGN